MPERVWAHDCCDATGAREKGDAVLRVRAGAPTFNQMPLLRGQGDESHATAILLAHVQSRTIWCPDVRERMQRLRITGPFRMLEPRHA
jgi:hypothetical protein